MKRNITGGTRSAQSARRVALVLFAVWLAVALLFWGSASLCRAQVACLQVVSFWGDWSAGLLSLAPLTLFDDLGIRVAMLFGSAVAGGTPLGGGSVAFPVLTKLLHVPVSVSQMFTVSIQSVGMTAAACVILRHPVVRVQWGLLLRAFLFGVTSLFVFSFDGLRLPGVWVKAVFSVFLCWAVAAHFVAARLAARAVQAEPSQHPVGGRRAQRRARLRLEVSLVCAGVLGGWLTAHMGTGADVVLYVSGLVVLSRVGYPGSLGLTHPDGVCVRSLTQTSVLLMAGLSIVSVLRALFFQPTLLLQAVPLWVAAVPSVLLGASLAAWALTHWLSVRLLGIGLAVFGALEWLGSVVLLPQPQSAAVVVFSLPVLGWLALRARASLREAASSSAAEKDLPLY